MKIDYIKCDDNDCREKLITEANSKKAIPFCCNIHNEAYKGGDSKSINIKTNVVNYNDFQKHFCGKKCFEKFLAKILYGKVTTKT